VLVMKSIFSHSCREQGFTLPEMLTVLGIMGILSAIAIPTYSNYKAQTHNLEAKYNLRTFMHACNTYWMDEGDSNACTVEKVANQIYGFVQANQVIIQGGGALSGFVATASHQVSSKIFRIDSNGRITVVPAV
jgi:prepilin-type N-terminal cleavage/methylation domain-containing protein